MHPRLISCVELVARVAHLLVAWPLATKISFESDDVGKLHESYTSEDEYIFYFEKIDMISGLWPGTGPMAPRGPTPYKYRLIHKVRGPIAQCPQPQGAAA